MTPTTKSADIRTGIRLTYAEQGDPSGVPVLLLPGYTDSWRSFERVLASLPRSVRAFALSQRGHGDSDRPATGYAVKDFAEDLAAFMDELEVGPAIVAGHSMGGSVAMRFALDHPERVLGLVLMSSFPAPSSNPAVLELWESSISMMTDPVDPQFVLDFQRSTLAQAVPPEFLATVVRESHKVPAQVWKSALHCFVQTDLSQEVGAIRAPTLVVWGDLDAFCSRGEQEDLAAAIEGARLVVFRGAGHGFHWEEPERFAALIAEFAQHLERPTERAFPRAGASDEIPDAPRHPAAWSRRSDHSPWPDHDT